MLPSRRHSNFQPWADLCNEWRWQVYGTRGNFHVFRFQVRGMSVSGTCGGLSARLISTEGTSQKGACPSALNSHFMWEGDAQNLVREGEFLLTLKLVSFVGEYLSNHCVVSFEVFPAPWAAAVPQQPHSKECNCGTIVVFSNRRKNRKPV